MTSTSKIPATRRRADAERNAATIVEAALQRIQEDGELNLTSVARAAGVSRVTLHAHFPTREALLVAGLRRAVAQLDETIAALPVDGTVTGELRTLLRSSWRFLARWRNLYVVASAAMSQADLRQYVEPVLGRVEDIVSRGQAGGELRNDLPGPWLVTTMYALLHAGTDELTTGRLTLEQADDVVVRTVLSLIRRGQPD